jgi:hypothetical protein
VRSYLFDGQAVSEDDPRFVACLAEAYRRHLRPLCACSPPGWPMYVARSGDGYVIKRMPDTGSQHDPGCDSFEPPPELSGLGDVLNKAIKENVDDGTTTLRLDFSLMKIGGRAAPSFGATESTTAQTDGARLSLRATLHYLWEEAGLHRWMPGMSGKRNWSVVRKYLLQATSDKTARGAAFASMLYVPETFSVEHKQELLARRIATLGPLATGTRSGRKLLLLIGEVKQFSPARYGHKMIVKHVPDTPFVLSEDAYRRLMRRCEIDLELWNADPSTHLLVVGTFGQETSGVLAMEELTLQVTTAQWLPFEHRYEAELLEVLVRSGRRFTKGLRYNLGSGRPIASLVLADMAERSVAMYLVPPGATEGFRTELEDLIAGSEFAHWVWHTSDEPMPAIPPPRSRDMRDFNAQGRDASARSSLDAQPFAA